MAETKETKVMNMTIERGMTVEDASKIPALQKSKCLLKDNKGATQYWDQGFSGYTRSLSPRNVYIVKDVVSNLGGYKGAGYWIEILREEPLPDGKKSLLSHHFNEDFIEMMKTAPNNEQVRGTIMQVLKRQPARELDTFEKLRDWIEGTFTSTGCIQQPVKGDIMDGWERTVVEANQAEAATQATAQQPSIEFGFTKTDVESGTCKYSNARSGAASIRFTKDDIESWLEDGENVETILEKMLQQAEDVDVFDMEDVAGTVEHTNYEDQDHDNQEVEFTGRNQQEALEEFIRINLPHYTEDLGL